MNPKKLSFEEIEKIEGGWNLDAITGGVCGLSFVLACSGIFAPLAVAPGAYCAVSLYATFGDYPRYEG